MVEINCADKICNRFKCGWVGGSATKKRQRRVARLKDAVTGEINLRGGEIVKIDPTFFFLAVRMIFINELVLAL